MLGILLVAVAGSAVVLVRLRIVLRPDGATGRVFLAEHTLAFAGFTRVRYLPARRGGYTVRPARLRITGRDERGRLRRIVLNEAITGLGSPVVTDWIRRRPELVAGDDRTAAFFASVLRPGSAAPTPPPIGGFGTVTGGHWLPSGVDAAASVAGHSRPGADVRGEPQA